MTAPTTLLLACDLRLDLVEGFLVRIGETRDDLQPFLGILRNLDHTLWVVILVISQVDHILAVLQEIATFRILVRRDVTNVA